MKMENSLHSMIDANSTSSTVEHDRQMINCDDCKNDCDDDVISSPSKGARCRRFGDATSGTHAADDDVVVGAKETKTVSRLRLFVLSVLVVSATCVGWAVYRYIRTSERAKFVEYYTCDTKKLFEAIGESMYSTVASMDLIATNIVYHARQQQQQQPNLTWPFITVPDFAARTAKTLVLSKGISFWFSVIVPPELRDKWEAYAWENRNIVNTTLQIVKIPL
jgi:hypothetical protein